MQVPRPEEGIESPQSWSYKQLSTALCKSSMHPQLLSHFSSPDKCFSHELKANCLCYDQLGEKEKQDLVMGPLIWIFSVLWRLKFPIPLNLDPSTYSDSQRDGLVPWQEELPWDPSGFNVGTGLLWGQDSISWTLRFTIEGSLCACAVHEEHCDHFSWS